MNGVAAHHCVLEGGGALSQVCGEGRRLSAVVSTSKLVSKGWREQGRPCHLVAALDPAFPNQQPDFADFQWPLRSGVGRGRSQGETESRGEVKAGAKEKWSKHNESALSGDSPLSLPLAYPGTEPASKKETDAMFACNPEKEYCKDPVYEWTAKCSRCQGTGEVSFYRKRGKEVISKCIACLGIGYVRKFTSKVDKVVDSDLSE